jgi:hypothetical protein
MYDLQETRPIPYQAQANYPPVELSRGCAGAGLLAEESLRILRNGYWDNYGWSYLRWNFSGRIWSKPSVSVGKSFGVGSFNRHANVAPLHHYGGTTMTPEEHEEYIAQLERRTNEQMDEWERDQTTSSVIVTLFILAISVGLLCFFL